MQPIFLTLAFLAAGLLVVYLVLRSFSQGELLSRDPGGAPAPSSEQDTIKAFRNHINRGNELLARYEVDQALEEFHAALKLRRHEPSLHFKIGRVFVQKEDFANAVKAFKNVTQLSPEQIEAYYELARIYLLLKKYEDAHQALAQALSLQPDHEETLKLKVKLLEVEGNPASALPILQRLITISHSGKKYRVQYAAMLRQLGRNEEALLEYEDLIDRDPHNANEYRLHIGQIYFDSGNYGRAIDFFKRAIQEDGTLAGDSTLQVQLGAALCNEGVKFFEEGNLRSAIQRYEEALSFDSQNADIHYNLGKAYASMHDLDQALQHFNSAVQLTPNDLASLFELAITQDQKGLAKDAINTYQSILKIQPGQAQAAFGLGTLYGFQGELEQAVHYLSEAIKADPLYVDAIYNLAVALERQKNYNKAIKMYQKVLSIDANFREAKSNLEHLRHMIKGQ